MDRVTPWWETEAGEALMDRAMDRENGEVTRQLRRVYRACLTAMHREGISELTREGRAALKDALDLNIYHHRYQCCLARLTANGLKLE